MNPKLLKALAEVQANQYSGKLKAVSAAGVLAAAEELLKKAPEFAATILDAIQVAEHLWQLAQSQMEPPK